MFLLFCEMRNMLKWYTTFYLNYTSSQPTWVFMIVQITERLWQIQTTKTFHISKTQYKQARRQLQPSFNYLEARQTSNEGYIYIYIYNTCALSKHIGNMCMRLRNGRLRRAFSRVSRRMRIFTYMLRQCTCILFILQF